MPLLGLTSYLSIFSKSQVSGKFFLVGISRAAGGPAPSKDASDDASDEGCASDEGASDEGATNEDSSDEAASDEGATNEDSSDEAASEYII